MQVMKEDIPIDLQNLVLEERTRNRFTQDNFLKAVNTLGFGHDGPLGVESDESVEEGIIVSAWRDGISHRSICESVDSVKSHPEE